mgnify:CR=1 FL=1
MQPSKRGRGLGSSVTQALCESLASKVEHIGLNVHVDNHAAQRVYRNLGFEVTLSYYESLAKR